MAIKLLIGGSPCTYWSIAQSSDKREVVAEGIGWELFKNYLIAKEKFKPDYFLYENNKSAAQPIKDQISRELGVDLMYINSALVSAQNRQRFYAFNWNVDQPTDRGIMLKDILETTTSEKGYALRVPAVGVGCRNRREDDGKLYRRFETSGIPKANALTTVQTDSMVAEFIAINTTVDGKAQCIRASCYKDGFRNLVGNTIDRRTSVAESIRIGTIENDAKKQDFDSQQYRVYSPDGKSVTLCENGGGVGAKTGLYACPVFTCGQCKYLVEGVCEELDVQIQEEEFACSKYTALQEPVCLRYERTEEGKLLRKQYEAGELHHGFNEYRELHPRKDGKTNTLSTVLKDNQIAIPVMLVKEATKKEFAEIEAGDCVDMTQPNSKTRRDRNMKDKCNCLMTGNQYYQYLGTVNQPIYEVENGRITIKGKKYPIRLVDGLYIIRKLTPIECERLQTLPDNYTAAVSNTQRYKGLGNGWTAEVIIHILNGALKDIPKDEEIIVLSMYDGIGTGRYCLDKMGFTNVKYHAYEIDKYAMSVAMDNYPDIIQHGDAFAVRDDDWKPPQTRSEWLDELLGGRK